MQVTVDRIEQTVAVLLLRDDETLQFNLPLAVLPEINEGDILNITITKDTGATADARNKSLDLITKQGTHPEPGRQ